MIAIDKAARIVWFRPRMIVRRAIGTWTFHNRCHVVCPRESVASSAVGETSRIPNPAIRTIGGSAEATGETKAFGEAEAERKETDNTETNRPEEHTAELQSGQYIVCPLLLAQKKDD